MKKDFVHLHCHSEYSLLDGAIRTDSLIKAAKSKDMQAIALTDHGNMYGAVEFYIKAKEEKIKPIIGCEIYLTPHSMKKKDPHQDKKLQHMTLLAKDSQGYESLIKLVSLAHLEGYYYKPRIDYETLSHYTKGIVALTGCLRGPIAMLITEGKYNEAKEKAGRLKELFKEDLYLEMMSIGIQEQEKVNEYLIKIGKELGIKTVATNDVHYINHEDAYIQDVLLCIQTGKLLKDEKRLKFKTSDLYFRSYEEMEKLFRSNIEAIRNTMEISEKCNLTIETDKVYLPHFDVPEGFDLDNYLEKLTTEGLKRKYKNISDSLVNRVNYELSVIKKMGYSAYFLIVQDFINFAKQNGIQVGPGRGSAAGSIVAYTLGITSIDPIKYNLLFERFLNPDRISLPDIDVDFCIKRRAEVIEYVSKKYGQDHVSQIITFGTMAARGVIRDVGRVQGVYLAEVDNVSKMIPNQPDINIIEALNQVQELKAFYDNNKEVKNLIEVAKSLEGLKRHASTHAAGVVISKDSLIKMVPLTLNEGQIVTQYDMVSLEKIGILKMDFLGLRNLTMIADTLRIIEENKKKNVDIDGISLENKATYDLLIKGETIGIFQLESRGMRSLIKELRPNKFEDIIALLALYRPGPLGSGMVQEFISNKHGKTKVKYELSQLEPILKETYGLILYQEQVMQIASTIAGFSLGQADVMRRAMGKKQKNVMAKLKNDFVEGAVKNKTDKKKADKIFELCEKFAEYGFNKSHSAAYAVISYQTAYLKANYPLEYMTALLTSVQGSVDKVSLYFNEAKRMGIEVLPPDINESLVSFSVSNDNIRFGLAAIKNVGWAAIDEILKIRHQYGKFNSFSDFAEKVDLRVVNKRVMESLIKSGALDSFGGRAQLLSALDMVLENANRTKKNKKNGMVSLFEVSDLEGMTSLDYTLPEVEEFTSKDKLKYEKELLGLYISGHPLSHIRDKLEEKITASAQEINNKKEGDNVIIGGIINGIRKVITRNQRQMMIFQLEDFTGKIPIVLFPGQSYEKCSPFVVEDFIVLIKGQVRMQKDDISIVCQEIRVFDHEEKKKVFHIEIEPLSNSEALESIKKLLIMYHGPTPVHFHANDKIIVSDKKYWIQINPIIISQIEKIVGEGKVWHA